jgi:hypothetical protein
MISHNQLFAIVAVTIALFLALVVAVGGQVHIEWFRELEMTVVAVALILTGFNLWAWRWSFLQGWFIHRPHLWGPWSVTIKSDWRDPSTGDGVDPFNVTFEVRQSFTSLHVRMSSDVSDGELVCANLLRKEDGGFRLIGTYRNEPNIFERVNSPIHYGTFILDVEGYANRPNALRGHYWTDRGTRGDMTAVRANASR